eukprot:TRINITY_DN3226_c0_g1_i5.p1 TRINITY_DN3226_c0_g1~~TRINITY_DN3226_c0_g1_i5.p1  ORF type:complete len:122 (+),score=30.76 TRINITY_DN3226_c0_g1_i5:112-477(+)
MIPAKRQKTEMSKKVGISFGTANFGDDVKWKSVIGSAPVLKGDTAKEMLNELAKNDLYELDTAFIYGSGASEEELGNILPEKDSKWLTSTKAHPGAGLTKQEIGRAVQQECRDRSRMPSSA